VTASHHKASSLPRHLSQLDLRRPRRDSLIRIQKSSHTSLQQLQHTNIPATIRAAIEPPRQTILRRTGEMLASFLSIGQILAIALPCTSILAVATLVGVWYYKRRTGEQVEALMAAAILRLRAERAEQATEIAALRAEAEITRAEVQRDHVEADRARTLAILEGRITEQISVEEAFGR
jgi:hypothetical protein